MKKEPKEEQEDDNGDGDGEEDDKVIVTEVTQKTETVAGLENLVLVPLPKMKGSSKDHQKVLRYPKEDKT